MGSKLLEELLQEKILGSEHNWLQMKGSEFDRNRSE